MTNKTLEGCPGPGSYSPSTNKLQSVKFPVAVRSTINTDLDAPGPGAYKENSTFDKSRNNLKGSTIGKQERNSFSKMSSPGPGDYNASKDGSALNSP